MATGFRPFGLLPPGTDSVEFPGRAVRALLQDPYVARYAGRTLPVDDQHADAAVPASE